MEEKNNKKNCLRLAVQIMSIILSVAVIVFAVLQIFEVYPDAIDILVPLMGLSQLCQAYLQWNSSRKVAYFSLGTAIFIFICAIAVFFVK